MNIQSPSMRRREGRVTASGIQVVPDPILSMLIPSGPIIMSSADRIRIPGICIPAGIPGICPAGGIPGIGMPGGIGFIESARPASGFIPGMFWCDVSAAFVAALLAVGFFFVALLVASFLLCFFLVAAPIGIFMGIFLAESCAACSAC